MYDTLLQLPLFQGMGRMDFSSILGKVKLHFVKYKAGDVIVKKGTLCEQLIFVVSGEITTCTPAVEGGRTLYTFSEHFDAPYVVEVQALLGLNTVYASTYTAASTVSVFIVSKDFVMKELGKHPIFRLNYMNLLSSRSQSLYGRLWRTCPDDMEGRIRCFILSHVEQASGQKRIKIKMVQLARILNDTRQNVSKALNAMQLEGLLTLHRGEIVVPDVSKLRY
jgi:CRP-like cAMP-binding protein